MSADLLLAVEPEKATALILIPAADIIDFIALKVVSYSILSVVLFLSSLFDASARMARYSLWNHGQIRLLNHRRIVVVLWELLLLLYRRVVLLWLYFICFPSVIFLLQVRWARCWVQWFLRYHDSLSTNNLFWLVSKFSLLRSGRTVLFCELFMSIIIYLQALLVPKCSFCV